MHITDFYSTLLEESKLSKDPKRKVCAAAFDAKLNRVASGWNGLPRGMKDSPERYFRPLKEFYAVHAETNLVASAARLGIRLEGTSLLVTEWQPCANCAGVIAQAGIVAVYYPVVPTSGKTVRTEWLENFEHARVIFKEVGILLEPFECQSGK